MSNLMIRNCIFAFKCTAVWEELDETAEEAIRFCQGCQKEVHYCETDDELVVAVRLNRCVAINQEFGLRPSGGMTLGMIEKY